MPAACRIHATAAVEEAVAGHGCVPDSAAMAAAAAYHSVEGAMDLLTRGGLRPTTCHYGEAAGFPWSEAASYALTGEDANLGREARHAGVPATGVAEPSRAISLDCLLPASTIDLSEPLAAVDATLHGADRDFQWHPPVGTETAHPFSRLALGMLPAWGGHAPHRLHVYTDGSSDAGRVGWAFLVLAEFVNAGRRFEFVGFQRGRVTASAPAAVRISDATNNTAEGLALFHALVWRCRSTKVLPASVPTGVHTDNLLMMGVPDWLTFCAKHRDLSISIAAVTELARGSGFQLLFDHVKAHSGHPWNELADWLASGASDHLPCGNDIIHPMWARSPKTVAITIDLTVSHWQGSVERPPVHNGRLLLAPSAAPVLPPQLAFAATEGADASDIDANIKFATANVLSLSPGEYRKGGTELLEQTARMHEVQKLLT